MFGHKAICDIDGTIADLMTAACARAAKQYAISFTVDDVPAIYAHTAFSAAVCAKLDAPTEYDEMRVHCDTERWWDDAEMYAQLAPYEDMKKHLLGQQEYGTRTLFVTARPDTDAVYAATDAWLQAQGLKGYRLMLGVSNNARVVLCQHYSPDFYYDDIPENLIRVGNLCPFTTGVMTNRPWNKDAKLTTSRRFEVHGALFRFT